MTVSVVIPTYKAAGFLARTLDSVAAQTRPPAEVVVADDASPDGTAAAAAAWGRTAPFPVRVVRLARNTGGPAAPLNAGIAAARGELVATLDHDDAFPPNKLADQVPVLAAHPDLGLVFGDLALAGPDPAGNRAAADWLRGCVAALPGRPLPAGGRRIAAADATAGVVRTRAFVGTCSNLLFPKRVWRRVGGFDRATTVSCDLAFLAAVAARHDLGYVATPSAVWTLHPDSFYRTASEAARLRDQLRVYGRLARRRLPPDVRADLRREVRQIGFDGAFGLRQAGHHGSAAACLWRTMRAAGPWPAGVLALAKLLPHKAVGAARRRAGGGR